MNLQQRFQCFQYEHCLTFVIAGATAVQIIPAHCWLKWWRIPKFDGINWLDIIMPIDKHSGFAGCLEPLTIYKWVVLSLDQANPFKIHPPKLVSCILGCSPHVSSMLWQCADTRYAQPAFQVLKKAVFILRYVGF